MKYLRPFNESIKITDLQELCDNTLAYLKDDGYKIQIKEQTIDNDIKNKYSKSKDKRTGREKIVRITIGKHDYHKIGNSAKGELFKWENIKDDLMPFLEILRDTFEWYIVSDYEVLFVSPGPYKGPGDYEQKTLSQVKSFGRVNHLSNSTIVLCSIDDVINEEKSTSYLTNNTDVLLGVDIILRLNSQSNSILSFL